MSGRFSRRTIRLREISENRASTPALVVIGVQVKGSRLPRSRRPRILGDLKSKNRLSDRLPGFTAAVFENYTRKFSRMHIISHSVLENRGLTRPASARVDPSRLLIGTRVDWRTFAAVWGAGLSTLLALSRIEWPFVSFEPGRPPTNGDSSVWVRVRIINPSKRSLVVVRASQFQRWRRSERIKFILEPKESLRQEIESAFAKHSYDKGLLVYVQVRKAK
jgi:hypothetical protein